MNRDDYIAIGALFYDAPSLQTAAISAGLTISTLPEAVPNFLSTRRISERAHAIYLQRLKTLDVPTQISRHASQGISILTPVDTEYPKRLLEISDPPAALFYKGAVRLLGANPCMAIVGTRDVTAYGREVTRTLTADLKTFFTIVSGLAAGVDAIAHQATLSGGGQTVAVMGTSFEQVYPKSNQSLYDEICDKGLVLTEYPLGSFSQKHFFPMRNRIVAGLSEGVLVCEAGERSGSLITARVAMEEAREVFCVPGSIFVKQNQGNHKLIQDGAKLITTLEDILVTFPYLLSDFSKGHTVAPEQPELPSLPKLSEEERQLLDYFSEEEVSLDLLVETSGFSIQKALQVLMQLELAGVITKTGSQYRRVS